MPGLHLLTSMDAIGNDERNRFMKTLNKMRHFPWYVTDVLYNDTNLLVGRSHYEGYPFTYFKNEKEVTLIEGAIYNKSNKNVKKELDEVPFAELSANEVLDEIRKFVLTTHGEFIVLKINSDEQKYLIFNDALGRLPFYYASSDNQQSNLIIMSREIKFIVPFFGETDYDKESIAEYLIFGHPLGERTLWKFIKRLPAAATLIGDIVDSEFHLSKVLTWNLESDKRASNRPREEAKELAALFLSSSRDIAQTFPKDFTHVVGLSGGLDSRATLAALVKIGANPIAYSYPSGENRIAKKIARTLKVKHCLVSSSFKITNKDFVYLTDGQISMQLRPLASYLWGVKEKAGKKALLYTGDGGWLLKCIRTLRFNISNIDELVQYIIETAYFGRAFDLDEVSSMLNMRKGAFQDHLRKHVMTYPEKTMEGKMVHFLFFERQFTSGFLGEDKNRLFLWSTTPFYSIDLFRASVKVAQRSKEYFILYRNFLESLNPSLSRIQYYDRILPLSTPDFLLKPYLSFLERLHRHFDEPGAMRAFNDLIFGKRRKENTNDLMRLIMRLSGEGSISFLDQSQVNETAKMTSNPTKLNRLATLIMYASLMKSQH